MAMAKKVLNTLGKVGKALTTENNIANGGGWSSILVPKKVNGKGLAVVAVGGTALSFANEGLKARNTNKMGRISYMDGPARMTKSYTSGAIPAMMQASNGNYAAFSDMAEEVVSGHNNAFGSVLDDYGANPAMIASLYGMGGR